MYHNPFTSGVCPDGQLCSTIARVRIPAGAYEKVASDLGLDNSFCRGQDKNISKQRESNDSQNAFLQSRYFYMSQIGT